MNFNKHSDLDGQHAFLSASKYHWINYDDEKLTLAFKNHLATLRGTELHEFAYNAIRLGIRLPSSKKTLNMYINDAIGFRMNVEQPLYYSENAFGTADSISFRKGVLRIHDLKTGQSSVSMHQLEVYAALFCLEYHKKPSDIKIMLRIYQSDKVICYEPPAEDILFIMDKIVRFDKKIEEMKIEEDI